jgi:dsRNA-specific ribonuclease
LGCLYLDKDLAAVETFLRVALLSRTKEAIQKRKWMDPKTKLQQKVLGIVKNRKFSPTYKQVLFTLDFDNF